MGRPAKYDTPEELQEAIDDYFQNGVKLRQVVVGKKDNQQVVEIPVPTITGLVLHLGFSDRASFYDYEKREGFSHTIKRARTRIEMEYEEQLSTSGNAGSIFALKNFGWRDKQEIEHSGEVRSYSNEQLEYRLAELLGKAGVTTTLGGAREAGEKE